MAAQEVEAGQKKRRAGAFLWMPRIAKGGLALIKRGWAWAVVLLKKWWPWVVVVLPGMGAVSAAVFLRGHPALPGDPTSYYYLLSAQAQALAAVLALVFTLSLVAAQLAQRYTSRLLAHVFGPWALLYLIPFLAAIIYSLLLLNQDFSLVEARASLLLGSWCLLSLAPYFFALRGRLSLKSLIQGQMKAALSRYRRGEKEPEALGTLDSLAMGAFAAHDYDTFKMAVNALRDMGQAIAQGRSIPDPGKEGALAPLIERLGHMGLRTMGDPTAPLTATAALRELGVTAAESKLDDAAGRAADSLGRVGVKAAEQGLEEAAGRAADSLERVGVTAAEQGLDWAAGRAADSLGRVGVTAAEHELTGAAGQAADSLGRMGAAALKHSLSLALPAVGRALRSLEERLGEDAVLGILKEIEGDDMPAFLQWYDDFKRQG